MAHNQFIQRPDSELQLCTIIRIGHAFSNKWIDRNFLWKAKHRIAIDWTYTNPAPESNCSHILITNTIEDIRVDDKSHQIKFIEQIHSHNGRVAPVIEQVTSIEMNLMRALHTLVPEDGILFIGNSMPIRDFSNVSIANRPDITVFANRGASGIDGLISTAAGLAVSTQRHCTIVLGDLSAIHDLASLLYLKQLSARLRIVIVNNSGGQIFQNLPLSESQYFSPTFDAAHSTDLASITRAMTIESHTVDHVEAIKLIPIPKQPQLQVIELCIDKDSDFLSRQKDNEALCEAIDLIWGQD